MRVVGPFGQAGGDLSYINHECEDVRNESGGGVSGSIEGIEEEEDEALTGFFLALILSSLTEGGKRAVDGTRAVDVDVDDVEVEDEVA